VFVSRLGYAARCSLLLMSALIASCNIDGSALNNEYEVSTLSSLWEAASRNGQRRVMGSFTFKELG
jgi:hypothetical protein